MPSENFFESAEITALIDRALAEDTGDGDHSSLSSIPAGQTGTGKVLFKQDGVLAGASLAKSIFHRVDPELKVTAFAQDGDLISKGTVVMECSGSVRSLLRAERTMLNFMQRLSGTATMARVAMQAVQPYPVKILDTRKTTPGLRLLEKWAVKTGGAFNHRKGLYDMIMLKDNHIDCSGGIETAIRLANRYNEETGKNLPIEVETRNLDEVEQVLKCGGVQRIMLDNFDTRTLAEAVKLIAGRFETEASGGITLDNIKEYAATGVDFISLGMLTHSVKSIDISFKISLT